MRDTERGEMSELHRMAQLGQVGLSHTNWNKRVDRLA